MTEVNNRPAGFKPCSNGKEAEMPITTEKGKPKRVFICNNCGWEGSFKELTTLIADEDGAAFKGCPRCRDDSGEYGKDLKLVLKPTSGRT